MTDVDAPNYRLVSVDPAHPEKDAWKNIIPAKDMLLESVNIGGGKLFAHYLKDVTTRVMRYDMDGTNETAIDLPGLGTAGGFGGKRGDTYSFYSYTSFTTLARRTSMIMRRVKAKCISGLNLNSIRISS